MRPTRFALTPEHLQLLSHFYVEWSQFDTRLPNPRYIHGAPAIDRKRPYGNSDVELDMVRILNVPILEPGAATIEGRIGTPAYERLLTLHRETQMALQIVLSTRSFQPGEYVNEDYGIAWKRVT